jgi:hypothetical protein
MLLLVLNLSSFFKLYRRLKHISNSPVLFVLFDNSFQSPIGKKFEHRNLELIFNLLRKMGIDFMIVRPLFGKRNKKKKSEFVYSAESFCIWPMLKSKFLHQDIFQATWHHLLEKIQPSLVIGQNLNFSTLGACAWKGITTAELQHGVMGDDYLEVTGIDLNQVGLAPDYFLTWHSSFEKVISGGNAKAVTIGYPSVIQVQEGGASNSTLAGHSPRVLVALSRGVTKSKDPFGLIRPSIDRVLKELESHSCEVVIRPHPLSSGSLLSKRIQKWWLSKEYPTASVVHPDQLGIAEALSGVDVVITFDGTMIIDAVLHGTYILYTGESDSLGVPEDIMHSGLIAQYKSYPEMLRKITHPSIHSRLESWQYKEDVLKEFIEKNL